MPTKKQIEANRRNAQKSTGPVTAAGKAVCAMNAFKTGLYARSLLIPGERLEDLQQLIADYYRHHRPATPEQRGILDDLIVCEWEIRRLTAVEAQMWSHQMEDRYATTQPKYPKGKAATLSFKSQAALQRRLDSTRRGRDRALRLLRELAANPIPVPAPSMDTAVTETPASTSPEIGSVPAVPPQPPSAPPNHAPEEPETPQFPEAA